MSEAEQSVTTELAPPQQVAEVEQVETEAQTDEQADAEPELVEIERNGKKYAIPKELQPELMLQSDYTRKSQQVAETRRELEERQQQFQQAIAVQSQLTKEITELAVIDRELEKYKKADWNALAQSDPGNAQQAIVNYQALKEAREQMANAIAGKQQHLVEFQSQGYAQAVSKVREKVEKEIPGWSEKVDSDLAKYVHAQGFSPQQARAIAADFPSVSVVFKAMKYDELMSKKAPPTPAPVAHVVKAKTNDRAPEKMSTEEWMKWRESQTRRK